jgi:cell division transport system permease protein
MTLSYKRAFRDILKNRFLSMVTIITIALSVLIVGAFGLFFLNAGDMMNTWKHGIRIMVYLKPALSEAQHLDIKYRLKSVAGVRDARFIPKAEALVLLKSQMKRQISLLENLRDNPLPDAFEVTLIPSAQEDAAIEILAEQIEALPSVESVEYGQRWVKRFINLFNLFKLVGYALGGLFFLAAVLIVANTIRLVLYSRREEIEIMRLVGATDTFIKLPFYLEALIQGAFGSVLGLLGLLACYISISSQFQQGFAAELIKLRFYGLDITLAIIILGMLVGWLGCMLSLKQFLKA